MLEWLRRDRVRLFGLIGVAIALAVGVVAGIILASRDNELNRPPHVQQAPSALASQLSVSPSPSDLLDDFPADSKTKLAAPTNPVEGVITRTPNASIITRKGPANENGRNTIRYDCAPGFQAYRLYASGVTKVSRDGKLFFRYDEDTDPINPSYTIALGGDTAALKTESYGIFFGISTDTDHASPGVPYFADDVAIQAHDPAILTQGVKVTHKQLTAGVAGRYVADVFVCVPR